MSKKSNQIMLATTIAPHGDMENQYKALNSWTDAGFAVLSVNTPQEIESLACYFSNISFYPAVATAQHTYGKPYIYLDYLLEALRQSGTAICGIINSDIHLLEPKFSDFISTEAQQNFVFGSRLDVQALDALEQGVWYDGFDYFFFDRQVLSLYPQDEFCLGLPWWDYWMILIPLAFGISVKRIVSPVAGHIEHPIHYGLEPWMYLGYSLGKYFIPEFELNAETMGRYNRVIFQHIDENPAVSMIHYCGSHTSPLAE